MLDENASRNPQAFGLIVTFAGVACFFPDALVVRLVGVDTMTIAVWRGLAAATTTFLCLALFRRDLLPGWAALTRWPALCMIALQGLGSLFFLASLGHTSAANSLLILATSPFLAALFGWFALKERVDRATGLAILAVFSGVAVIAAGSWGGGALLGDAFSFLNAVTIAAYYVILRYCRGTQLIVPIALGYLLTSALALPFAPMTPLDARQALLVFLSGGVILAGGVALLQIGPRYLPAAEVTMITMLEIVVGPLLVWWVIGENPGRMSLIGGAIILTAIFLHSLHQLRPARPAGSARQAGTGATADAPPEPPR